MFCIKVLCAIAAIMCLMSDQFKVTGYPANDRTIYATDGKNCHMFRSYSAVIKKNDNRRRNNKRELLFITKAGCRSLCRLHCKTQEKPVCGEYADAYVTFINKCEMRKAACLNGQAFVKVSRSKCNISLQ